MSGRSSSSSPAMSQAPVATYPAQVHPLEGHTNNVSVSCGATTTAATATTTVNNQQTTLQNFATTSTISTPSTLQTNPKNICMNHPIIHTNANHNSSSKKRKLQGPPNIICTLSTAAATGSGGPPSHKKRKGGLVRRTHSPKNVPSPKSTPVKPLPQKRLQQQHQQSPGMQHQQHHQQQSSPPLMPPISPRLSLRHVAPTIKGVSEGARVVLNGNIMVIPTESTYVACTVCHLATGGNINTSSKNKTSINDANDTNSDNTNITTTNSKRCLELMILANVKAAATAAAVAVTKANNANNNAVPAPVAKRASPTPYGVYYKRPLVLVQSVMDVGNIIPLPIKVYAVQRPPATTSTTSTATNASSIPEHAAFENGANGSQQPLTLDASTNSNSNDNNNSTSATSNVIKAAFSETRQVLQRLASLYWPGPIEIYVSVEQKRQTNEGTYGTATATPATHADGGLPPVEQRNYPKELLQPFPLPLKQRETNTRCHVHYVGFKCPSHPLTGRILTEVTNQQKQKQKQSATASPIKENTLASPTGSTVNDNHTNDKKRSNAAIATNMFVMGVDCYSVAASSYCTKATEVCDSLLIQSSSSYNHKAAYVLDGEDKREMFVVPTCQIQDTTSLYIDAFHRCIYICGTSLKSATTPSMSTCGGDAQQIRRALLMKTSPGGSSGGSGGDERQRSTSAASAASLETNRSSIGDSQSSAYSNSTTRTQNRIRVMQAVLRKWKVIDFRI
mmetsp:Transcript_28079/g.39472  ORF Transcript_28079/g.39472 Transcript_28079/m.39472 type:complete len:734 (+) Transcript_28079:289-2490(+)